MLGSEMNKIIAVASGKGGVGKSTLAANLAVSLANYSGAFRKEKKNLKIALIDIDFYGPSVPQLMGGGKISINEEQKFIPARKHEVKFISISFFLEKPDDPVIWRGPMFSKAISQLFGDVSWGDVDLCIVDLPPGTGDAQLSLCQQVPLAGALLVTTPQELALSDVRRAVRMFEKVNVPVLGVVENMSGFELEDGSINNIFGSGGGETLAKDYNLDFLGKVPLKKTICEAGDSGSPEALNEDSVFHGISAKLLDILDRREEETQKIEIVN